MEDDNEEIVHLLQKKHLTQNDANDANNKRALRDHGQLCFVFI